MGVLRVRGAYASLHGVLTVSPDDAELAYPALAMVPLVAPEAFFCCSLSSVAMRSLRRPISSACCVILSINWAESLLGIVLVLIS